jgi:hypothetical protein
MVHVAVVWSLLALGADPGRSYLDIKTEFRAALRREAAAQTFAERSAAVCDLARIHREIVADERFPRDAALQDYRREIAVRLFSVQNDLQRQLRRDRAKRGVGPASIPAAGPTDLIDAQSLALANQLALAGYLQGGPVQLAATGSAPPPRGGDMTIDNGLGLVELIQRTIRPEHWDVNGGPGTIVYFAPLRCLVVRASGEIHEGVGGLIDGLRAAGP